MEPTQKIEGKPSKRLSKVLETLRQELENVEAYLDLQVHESVQAAEARVTALAAEDQQQAVTEAQETIRKEVTEDLLKRFDVESEQLKADFEQGRKEEFEKLKADFEERRQNAIAATEAAAQSRLEQALNEAERSKDQVEEEYRAASAEFEAERSGLNDQIKTLEDELTQAHQGEEKDLDLNARLAEVTQQKGQLAEEFQAATTGWNAERAGLKAESELSREELLTRFDEDIEKLKADFEQRRKKAIVTTEGAAEVRFQQALYEAKQEKERVELEMQANASNWFQTASDEWDEERNGFTEQIQKLEDALSQANAQTEESSHTRLTEELEAKLAELTRVKDELAEQFRTAETQWNTEREQLKGALDQLPQGGSQESLDFVRTEISRVDLALGDLAKKIEDSSSDMSTQIRANRQSAELKAFLKGLRFSLGEVEA